VDLEILSPKLQGPRVQTPSEVADETHAGVSKVECATGFVKGYRGGGSPLIGHEPLSISIGYFGPLSSRSPVEYSA
jgi:hypothetical protein